MVLIQDECTARGAPPLVWIFETLTNFNAGRRHYSQPPNRETRFLTRIELKPTQSQPSQSQSQSQSQLLVFQCQGTMEIAFQIPPTLTKVLGANKSKHEARMSSLIQRQIEKDLYQTMELWQSKYLQWIATATTPTATSSRG